MNWFIIPGFILGAILGSFIKVLIDRGNWKACLWERSYCPKCQKKLQFYDLFPVLSYIFLKGKCRYCKKKITIDYLLTETLVGTAVGLLFYTYSASFLTLTLAVNWVTALYFLEIIFKILAILVLSAIFIIDLKTGLIPNKITYPASFITVVYLIATSGLRSWLFYQGLLANQIGKYLLPPYSTYFTDHLFRIWQPFLGSVLSAIVAALFFVLLIVITRGRGMGWGDVKFVLFIGLIVGFPNAIVAIFLAFLSGAVFSVGLILLRKKHFGQTIPFGPFLSIGAFLALLWGQQILGWYLNSFKLGY